MTRTFGYLRQILSEAKQFSGMIKLEIFNKFLKIKCESMKTLDVTDTWGAHPLALPSGTPLDQKKLEKTFPPPPPSTPC